MGKMTGMEPVQDIPQKVLLLYEAVQQLIGEGVDVNDIRVSSVTERAGIGKGTAYDYFDSKEEIIACAFIFYINRLSGKINDTLLQMGSLEEQVNFLFDRLDRESAEKYCFVRCVHLMTDNSRFSQMMQQKLKGSPEGRKLPEYLFGSLISRGRERGEIRGDMPAEYLIYSVFCRILTYMMFVGTEECFETDARQMRSMVIEGILGELRG